MILKTIFVIISLTAKAPKKNNENSCSKPMENLIVVNFTDSKLTVYVNNKKIGVTPKQDQKNFKKTLPVGAANIKILNAVKQAVYEEGYTVVALGKQTCKKNKAVIIRQ